MIGAGHAEHLRDDQSGQRHGERADEVHRRSVRDYVVDQLVDDLLRAGPHRLDRASGERTHHQFADPGVLRRVHVQHDERVPARLGEHGGVRSLRGGPAEHRIGVHPPHILVTSDQKGGATGSQPHDRNRILTAPPGEVGIDALARFTPEWEDRQNPRLGHDRHAP